MRPEIEQPDVKLCTMSAGAVITGAVVSPIVILTEFETIEHPSGFVTVTKYVPAIPIVITFEVPPLFHS